MPVCDGCGFSFNDTFKFCPQCGRAKPEAPSVKLEVEVKSRAHDFDCPLCRDASAVQKVSAIVGGSTSISQGSSSSSGSSSVYAEHSGEKVANAYSYSSTSSYNKSQTELAKKLTLPDPPVEPQRSWYSAPGCWSGGAGVVGVLLVSFLLFKINSYGDLFRSIGGGFLGCGIGVVAVGLGAGLAAIVVGNIADSMKGTDEKYQAAMEDYRREMQVYAGLQAQWEKLYYCHKHDVVYTTTLQEAVPVGEAISACYLWSNKDNA